jgi:amino acid transporter
VFIALLVVTVVYALVQIASYGAVGPALVGSATPLSDAATAIMGPAGGAMLGIAVVLSTFGYLCGMILAVPRALFAFARDGLLPRALSAVHPRFRTPWLAIIAQAAICLILALSSGFEPLVILANLAVLFVYLGCAAAAWQLRRKEIRDDDATTLRPIPGSAVGPPLAALVILALLTSITPREWAVSAAVAGVGIVLWFFTKLPRRASRSP